MGRVQGQPALAATAVMHDMFDDLLATRRGSQRPLAKRTDRDLPQYGLKITPSAAARRLAGQLWPDVQKQRRLAPGVYGFTCAGHGGVIAVIGKAQLSPAHVAAARDAELTELVVIAPGKTYSTAAGYRRADLEALAVRPDCQSAELWVGEEDAGWATIFHEQPELLAGAINAGSLHDGGTMCPAR